MRSDPKHASGGARLPAGGGATVYSSTGIQYEYSCGSAPGSSTGIQYEYSYLACTFIMLVNAPRGIVIVHA